jgi:hypothetical protein
MEGIEKMKQVKNVAASDADLLAAAEKREEGLTQELARRDASLREAQQGINELKDLIVEKDFDMRNLRRQYQQLDHAYKALKAST